MNNGILIGVMDKFLEILRVVGSLVMMLFRCWLMVLSVVW